jgi:hypothetical protein
MPNDDPSTRRDGSDDGDDSRDPLDAMLRGLPGVTLDRRVEVQTLRRARAVLLEKEESGLLVGLRGFWERAVAPVLVMGTVASYLAWAVQAAGSLYQ